MRRPMTRILGVVPFETSRVSERSRLQGAVLRYSCTKAIAMLPSPTAAATRLTCAERTSPQAKMPGTLVSRR